MKQTQKKYIKINDFIIGYSVFTHSTYRVGKVSELRTIKSGELLAAITNERNMLEIVITDPMFVFRDLK